MKRAATSLRIPALIATVFGTLSFAQTWNSQLLPKVDGKFVPQSVDFAGRSWKLDDFSFVGYRLGAEALANVPRGNAATIAGTGDISAEVQSDIDSIGAAGGGVVSIPAGSKGPSQSSPSGQVNNNTAAFILANGTKASFIFATEDGTISAWNGGTASTVIVDNSGAGAVYEGLAIGTSAIGATLYAPNFKTGGVDVFDGKFNPVTLAGNFTDPNLPAGFAPFNIWNIGGKLYAMYAKQNGAKTRDTAGPGAALPRFTRGIFSAGPILPRWSGRSAHASETRPEVAFHPIAEKQTGGVFRRRPFERERF